MENIDSTVLEKTGLEFESDGIKHFVETTKWTTFLSIAGFVFMGILTIALIVIIFSGGLLSTSTPFAPAAFIPLCLLLLIYYFPIYYLYQFSRYSKKAVASNDSGLLSIAMKYLKFHYRFMGILVIIIFGIYLLIAIILLITKAFI